MNYKIQQYLSDVAKLLRDDSEFVSNLAISDESEFIELLDKLEDGDPNKILVKLPYPNEEDEYNAASFISYFVQNLSDEVYHHIYDLTGFSVTGTTSKTLTLIREFVVKHNGTYISRNKAYRYLMKNFRIWIDEILTNPLIVDFKRKRDAAKKELRRLELEALEEANT